MKRRGLRALQKEAQQATRARGHRMTWTSLAPLPGFNSPPEWARGTCRDCGMEVDLTVRPEPNGIDIGGEAVALNCTGAKR